ncbi:MAG: hypothetical protein KatS3mg131_2589 [Candidatus Tectimicrobiota bacterium]|nr:MAG: hypothetical protein KatS3mg131_2589 [Candidatus Tectomicrobia bacterium]
MRLWAWLWGCAVAAHLLLAPAVAARTMYVTDTFEIVVRSEKDTSTGRNIIRLLPTGTPVEVLETDESWATIRLSDGRTGYVLKRYLISRLPYKEQAEQLQSEVEQQRARLATLEQQLAELRTQYEQLQRVSEERATQLAKVSQDYQQLRQEASQYLQLKAAYTKLQGEHGTLRQQYTELSDAYLVLKKSRNVMWFLSGGGVMLAGWIIGMVTERFRSRRRRQSGYSFQLPS